ncbi:MAG: hypothetical protein ABI625_17415 [bacterium]
MLHALVSALRSLALAATILCAVVSCSAITLPGDRGTPCGPEYRVTSALGSLAEASGTRLASANVNLTETRDANLPTLGLVLYGRSQTLAGPLRGHVVAARIVATNGDTIFRPTTLEQIPAAESGGGALLRYLGMTYGDHAMFDHVRSLLVANALVVELDTDDPSAEHIRIPMTLERAGDFTRLMCV